MEEQFVFPRLQAAQREVALVSVLLRQHQRGREVTDETLRLAATGKPSQELARLLRAFERMYRPHAAREGSAARKSCVTPRRSAFARGRARRRSLVLVAGRSSSRPIHGVGGKPLELGCLFTRRLSAVSK